MAKENHKKSHKPSQSKLSETHIAYEYDVSWQQARESVKERTHK